MKKLLSRLIWAPVGLLLVTFLVANRHAVPLSFDPFNTSNPTVATPALPLWVWLMLMLLIGYFLGALTNWVSGREKRLRARAERKELHTLRREVETNAASNPGPSGENLPVLKAS